MLMTNTTISYEGYQNNNVLTCEFNGKRAKHIREIEIVITVHLEAIYEGTVAPIIKGHKNTMAACLFLGFDPLELDDVADIVYTFKEEGQDDQVVEEQVTVVNGGLIP